jgi:hypothetical protein
MLENTIEKFQNITKFPISDFLLDSNNFFTNDFNNIVSFYSGNKNTLDRSQINKLNSLAERAQYIQQIFRNRKEVFKSVDYWELLDLIEDIKVKLQTSQNISKYLRSSIVKNVDKLGFVFDKIMNDNETLEDITLNILNDDSDNGWFDLALENDLKEINWDISGGTDLKIRKKIFQADLVTSMIDNTIGENIYGKDIKKLFNYIDDDLEILSPKDTVFQCVEILSKLSKGDIPEYRNLGMDSSIYKGVNYSTLNYSSIVRELNKNFATDDLFRNFNVLDIKLQDGDLYVEFQIDTKYDLVVIKNMVI